MKFKKNRGNLKTNSSKTKTKNSCKIINFAKKMLQTKSQKNVTTKYVVEKTFLLVAENTSAKKLLWKQLKKKSS